MPLYECLVIYNGREHVVYVIADARHKARRNARERLKRRFPGRRAELRYCSCVKNCG